MNCENCQDEHEGTYGSGRFCSSKCARGFSTKEKRSLINEKVRLKLTKEIKIQICAYCKSEFLNGRKRKTCSKTCSMKMNWTDDEYRQKMSKFSSENAKRQHENKTGFGWKSRKNLEPSYPESIAIKVLDESSVNYEREFRLEKYFVDFVLIDYKIAIEIDGQQHKKPERKIIDDKKDEILKSKGYEIYRISFPEDNIIDSINSILASIPSA